ncbi:uncharacterized protein PAC_09217 [Phialocephala subalpina]|uniref:Tat pathway signal sequence n=1 Tax=Phialocephala subalpina TaxID=576137 RepID=A0A1L7X2R4_9HELO|nr:uncharacterized protein PAC_09217 [Phialocephala subalpina]
MKGRQSDQYFAVQTSEDATSKEGFLEKGQTRYQYEASFWQRHKMMVLAQLVILGLWTLIMYFVALQINSLSIHGPDLIHFAREAIFWEERKFKLGDTIQEDSIYSGRPSQELDRAWHDLLNVENIRVDSDTMKHLGREQIGVRIPGEENFIGTLNVYHEIHCLKRIHQYMYQDHYFPDIDDSQREMNRLHNEHCIDFLRQSAMCHGDVGLITFEWSPTNLIPIANATTHQCVNWEKLDQWTRERSVDMLQPGWLVHPTLGPAFPMGEGDKIGAATGHVHGP